MGQKRKPRRVDRIRAILLENGGRLRSGELLRKLRQAEENPTLPHSTLYLAIRLENDRLREQGEAIAFRTAREGGDRGWYALEKESEFAPGTEERTLEQEIRTRNRQVDAQLRERINSLSWVDFESAFLEVVLEKLGFQDVELTQRTRDGGVDARVSYQRGIVAAQAIVSAKHWQNQTVPVSEVRNLRGIKGDEDTAIIVTTGRFSTDAKKEAAPSQNQRVVFLIDGDQLVEICKKHQVGVTKVELPDLFVVDDEFFSESTDDDDVPSTDGALVANEVPTSQRIQRLRTEMLGDPDRGLSATEVADLLGLKEGTIRTYLSNPDRKRELGDRLRADPAAKERALAIVSARRSTQ